MLVMVDYVKKMTVKKSVSMANMDQLSIRSSCLLVELQNGFLDNKFNVEVSRV